MKAATYIQTFLVAAALTGAGACESFLDKPVQDDIAADQALGTIENIRAVLMGAYAQLLDNGGYGSYLGAYNALKGGTVTTLDAPVETNVQYDHLYTFSTGDEDAGPWDEFYSESYLAIYQCNAILDALLEVEGEQAEKDEIAGQALALRALTYFNLVRVYGQPYAFTADASHLGVAVLVEPAGVNDFEERKTVAEVYAQIEADLEAAEALLGTNPDNRFVDEWGVRAMLAQVYLNQQNWQLAAEHASEVIASGETALATEADWLAGYAAVVDAEAVFWLDPTQQFDQAAGYDQLVGFPIGGNEPDYPASQDYLDLFAATDVRGGATGFADFDGHLYTTKLTADVFGLQPKTVVRLAELYLIRAEALANLNRPELAVDDLNAVHERVNPGGDSFASTLAGQALLDSIAAERWRELGYEGHRFFDLVRQGRDVQRTDCRRQPCSVPYPDNRFVMPFTEDQLISNPNLVQNEGY